MNQKDRVPQMYDSIKTVVYRVMLLVAKLGRAASMASQVWAAG